MVNTKSYPYQSIPKRQKQILRCRTYSVSRGILTSFPFLLPNLWVWLGPTNPWLICIAKEPLPFQWKRVSLFYDPTTAWILISLRSIQSRECTSTLKEHLSTTMFSHVCSIGNRLSPVHFQGPLP